MLATQIEVSDGTLNIINVGIEFFKQADISVSLEQSDPLVEGVDYQWTNATTIQFLNTTHTPGGLVPNGVDVIIRRDTQQDEMLNVYDGGAPFSRLTLDENFEQLLFLSQEFAEGLGLDGLRDNLTMNGYKVVDLGDPTDPGDATNKGYVDGLNAKTLRTPENQPVLPDAATRANRILGFDASGNVIATLPTAGDATALALDLADDVNPANGAALVGFEGDTVRAALLARPTTADLSNSADITKGSAMVGHKRQQLLSVINSVAEGLSANAVNVWEFADLATGYVPGGDPSLWDWTPAVQAAVDFCQTTFPARPLAITTLCKLGSSVMIDRPLDGELTRDQFTIFGVDGGGFIVDSAIAMFSSSITPGTSGGQDNPCSQTLRLSRLVLTATDPSLNAYVMEGNKILRMWIEGCDISFLKFNFTTSYLQSIYFIANNIRQWEGTWIHATGGSYDVRFTPGNLVEHGENFMQLLSSTSDKEVTGCSVDGSCIEGLDGFGILYSHARGFSVTNNYFEANALQDIIANSFPAVPNRGITHSGNMHAVSAANKLDGGFYPVVWGFTQGGVSLGNTSDHNMNAVRPDTQVVIMDHANGEVQSNNSRSRPGDIMYGSVSPQVSNASYGDRAWKPGSIVFNNAGALAFAGWITPDGTNWYPFGPTNDGSFWRFERGDGTELARFQDGDLSLGTTALWVRYHNDSAFVLGQVQVGAADSGGSGYRLLRVANT